MIAARRQLDGLARLDHQSLFERTHGHHPVIDGHFVDLDPIGDIGGTTDKPIRLRALVLDPQITATDLRATGRGTAPGLRDHEIAGSDLLGMRRYGKKPEHDYSCDRAADWEREWFHLHVSPALEASVLKIQNRWV